MSAEPGLMSDVLVQSDARSAESGVAFSSGSGLATISPLLMQFLSHNELQGSFSFYLHGDFISFPPLSCREHGCAWAREWARP